MSITLNLKGLGRWFLCDFSTDKFVQYLIKISILWRFSLHIVCFRNRKRVNSFHHTASLLAIFLSKTSQLKLQKQYNRQFVSNTRSNKNIRKLEHTVLIWHIFPFTLTHSEDGKLSSCTQLVSNRQNLNMKDALYYKEQ